MSDFLHISLIYVAVSAILWEIIKWLGCLRKHRWRPIGASTPRNTPVLVTRYVPWLSDSEVALCYLNPGTGIWQRRDGSEFTFPTHWLPLPEFP